MTVMAQVPQSKTAAEAPQIDTYDARELIRDGEYLGPCCFRKRAPTNQPKTGGDNRMACIS